MLRSENVVPPVRRTIAFLTIWILFGLLVAKLSFLMVFQHRRYLQLAEANRIRVITLQPSRGNLLDRNGVILAANKPAYVLSVIRAELENEAEELGTVARLMGVNAEVLNKNLARNFVGRFTPARISRDVTVEQLSLLEERNDVLPGIRYDQIPIRSYPLASSVRFTHVMGYAREIAPPELETMKEDGYASGDILGAEGVEKAYEGRLRGKKGYIFQQVDAHGRMAGLVEDRPPLQPSAGEDLRLNIDAALQQEAEAALEGRRGSIVMMDAVTGGVLVLASKPDYDLEEFAGFIDSERWESLLADPGRPLLNRAVSGLYPPGSTAKLVTTVTALETGAVDTNWTVYCSGALRFGTRVYHCWQEKGHGRVNLPKAIVESCNVYFYQLSQKLELDKLHHYASQFGLGSATGIDFPTESRGNYPNAAYMNRRYGKGKWSRGSLLNIGIGQGEVLVTPLQMACLIARVGQRGRPVRPKLAVDEGSESVSDPPISISASTWEFLHRQLFQVVNAGNGTAHSSRPRQEDIRFSGKTGTAENPHGDPHSWFIGYASRGEEMVAIAVVVENAGHGGTVAAPIAGKLVERYFSTEAVELAVQ